MDYEVLKYIGFFALFIGWTIVVYALGLKNGYEYQISTNAVNDKIISVNNFDSSISIIQMVSNPTQDDVWVRLKNINGNILTFMDENDVETTVVFDIKKFQNAKIVLDLINSSDSVFLTEEVIEHLGEKH